MPPLLVLWIGAHTPCKKNGPFLVKTLPNSLRHLRLLLSSMDPPRHTPLHYISSSPPLFFPRVFHQMDRSRTSSTAVSTPDYYSGSSQDTYPYNGKVLLAAVILLSIVIFFVILLHIYARWFLGRHRPGIARVISGLPLQTLASHIDHHEVPCFSKGLDPRVVASLPMFVCEASSSTTLDCVVCLSVMEEGEVGRELPRCRHVFHVECVDMWLMTHSTCPLCRAQVAKGEDAGPAVAGEAVEVVVVVDEEVGGVEGNVTVDIDMQLDATNVMKGDDVSSSSSSSSCSSSSTSSSCSSSLSCCSLKRMVSKSRSESKVFPSGTV